MGKNQSNRAVLQDKVGVWLTMGLLVVDVVATPFAYAGMPIEVDKHAPVERQAQLNQTGNGIMLVNIAGPNGSGVSRNDYTKFNVPETGVVLNNSYELSNTQLAGYVPGNANMMRGSASIIVNEVTAPNISNINGFLEVAGKQASVVVANPNGIIVDGGGFINTERAILTTGKPEYDINGNLESYRVESGTIDVEGKGLNAKGASSLEILTEATQINAGIWSNDSQIRVGKNSVNATSLDIGSLGESNQVGLDVAAIGGMYANSITMKGTNGGLGVNVQGNLSSVYATSIEADGIINVGGAITSNGASRISGFGVVVEPDAIIQGDESVNISSQSVVDNQGLINSNNKTSINVTDLDNKENGRIYGNTVAITADTILNHTNEDIEKRYKDAADKLTTAKNALENEWKTDITAYKSDAEMEVHRERIKHLTKIYDSAKEDLDAVQRELDAHSSGTIASRKRSEITAKNITNVGNGLLYSSDTMKLTAADHITNSGATIQAGGTISISTRKIVNDNAGFGMKRISNGVTKHPDKVRVDDIGHPEEGMIFDVSEFPDIYGSGGYGVAHKVPVIQEDGSVKMKPKEGIPAVHNFTYIRSEEEHTHVEVTNDNPGIISAGGNIDINGDSFNINSKIISGGAIALRGGHENISDSTSDKVIETGTTQLTVTKRVRKSGGIGYKRIREWKDEIFTTPTVTDNNIKPIGTVIEHAEDILSEMIKKKVNNSLDPFGTGSGFSTIVNPTIDSLKVPTFSLYKVNPEITATILIEVDPAFTNKKQFISSDYMLNALVNNPERRMKKLGDGYYEQSLINRQILELTGSQYLTGYTDNESEYKALLDAGIAYGKQFNLKPGITLTEEQMKAITTDMVWLETRTILIGDMTQEVLYPKVYLATPQAKLLDSASGLISGREIIVDSDKSFYNSGNMSADSFVVRSNTVENSGRIQGGQIVIDVDDSIHNTGNIHGEEKVALYAGNDITIDAETRNLKNQESVYKQGRVGIGTGGQLDIRSNHNISLKGALIYGSKNATMSITADNDIDLGTKKVSSKKDMTASSVNYVRAERETELGTSILADGDVTIVTKGDINIRQGTVNSEQGKTSIVVSDDVIIENGETYSRDEYGVQYKEKGLLSRTVNTIRKDSKHRGVITSTIGGASIHIQSGKDTNIKGSNLLGTNDVSVVANASVRTDSAEDKSQNESYQHSKKSGLMGAGIGFTIGSKKMTDTLDSEFTKQVVSNIASTKGSIHIRAGESIHSSATNIVGKEGIALSADNIMVDGKYDMMHIVQTHEEKQSGLTVSVGGSIANAMSSVQQLAKRANNRQNSTLSAFEYGEAANEIKHVVRDIATYNKLQPITLLEKEKAILEEADHLNAAYRFMTGDEMAIHPDVKAAEQAIDKNNQKQSSKDKLFDIRIGFGSSGFQQNSIIDQDQYVGSALSSNGKIDIIADSNDKDKGDINIVGSTVTASEIELKAGNDLVIGAAGNSASEVNSYTSSGWSIGAIVSPHGNGLIGIEANRHSVKEHAIEKRINYTASTISGIDTVKTESTGNTEITGARIEGNRINITSDADLVVKSLQEIHDYKQTSRNKSISLSYGVNGLQNSSGQNFKGTVDSHFTTVTSQAGIYAGEGGYHVDVNNNTQLVGSVISGETTNNHLRTDTLSAEDIHNEATYEAKKSGINLFMDISKRALDKSASAKLIPLVTKDTKQPIKGSASSRTHSVITPGRLDFNTITGDELHKETTKSLNRLNEIFDRQKVEEKQLLAEKLGKFINKSIGDVSRHMVARAKSDSERRKWEDGGEYKTILHAVGGGVVTHYAGGQFSAGALGGASDDILHSVLKQIKNESARRAAEYAVLTGVAKVLDEEADSALAQQHDAIEYNRYGHLLPGEFVIKDGQFYRKTVYGQLEPVDIFPDDRYIIAWEEDVNSLGNGQDYKYLIDKNGRPILESKKKIDGSFTSIVRNADTKSLIFKGTDDILSSELGLVPVGNVKTESATAGAMRDTFGNGVILGLGQWIDGNIEMVTRYYDNPKLMTEDALAVYNVIKDHPEMIKEIPAAVWASMENSYNILTDPNVPQSEKGKLAGGFVGDVATSMIPMGGPAKTVISKVAPRLVAVSKTAAKVGKPKTVVRNELVEGQNVANVHFALEKVDVDNVNIAQIIENDVKALDESLAQQSAKIITKDKIGIENKFALDDLEIKGNREVQKGKVVKKKSEISDASKKDTNKPKARNGEKVDHSVTSKDMDIPSKSNSRVETGVENIAKQVYSNGEQFLDKAKDRLKPNIIYMSNGYTYETDSLGRIINVKGELSDVKAPRNNRAQLKAGGADRLDGDHGGHLVASQFGGSGELDNLVAMAGKLNQGEYKRLENIWAKSLAEGRKVEIDVSPVYEGNSLRPNGFNIKYLIDGSQGVVVKFAN